MTERRRETEATESRMSSTSSREEKNDIVKACAYRVEHGRESPLDTDDTIILVRKEKPRKRKITERRDELTSEIITLTDTDSENSTQRRERTNEHATKDKRRTKKKKSNEPERDRSPEYN